MSTSAAVPATLEAYSRRASELDHQLAEAAGRLRMALDAFRHSRPEGGSKLPPDLDGRVSSLARHSAELDAWVGKVGQAFERADRGPRMGPFRPGTEPGARVVRVDDKVLARRIGGKKEPKKRGEWNLETEMKRAPRDQWRLATTPPNCEGLGLYTGGGFLIGPGGEKFWIVVPNLGDGHGHVYNADMALPMGWAPVTDLGGQDGGWVPLAASQGTIELGHESMADRFWAAIASTAGYTPLEGESVGKDMYSALYVDPKTGEPTLIQGQRAALTHPDGGHDKLGLTIAMSDGTTMQVDPHSADLNRELYRNPIVREARARPDTEETLPNAVGLGMMAGDAFVTAWELDKRDLVHYQVVFEQNGDRRRAMIRTYHVTSNDGKYFIWSSYLFVDDKGQLQTQGINWRRGAMISAPDTAFVPDTGATQGRSG